MKREELLRFFKKDLIDEEEYQSLWIWTLQRHKKFIFLERKFYVDIRRNGYAIYKSKLGKWLSYDLNWDIDNYILMTK